MKFFYELIFSGPVESREFYESIYSNFLFST